MSKKIYCIAQFRAKDGRNDELFDILKSLEPNTIREDGCIQYIVTRNITDGKNKFPIAFNEIWASVEDFNAHCKRDDIVNFFQKECLDKSGLVEEYLVQTYSDEPNNYDKPKF